MTVPRVDLKRLHRPVYDATAQPRLVEVPPLPFLMIDGQGDPDGDVYRSAVSALYQVAYGVRGQLKPVVSYSVMPSQGRWYGDVDGDRANWKWTMMIAQPEQVTPAIVDAAKAARRAKDSTVDRVRLETLAEGTCAQILHIGPYKEEPATLERLYAYVASEDHVLTGAHHEIYLSDHRRVAPEKLRTILRYPVSRTASPATRPTP